MSYLPSSSGWQLTSKRGLNLHTSLLRTLTIRRHEEARRFERKSTRVYDKKEEMNRSITRLSGIASTFTRGFRSTAFVAMPIKVRSFAIQVYPQFLSNASIGAAQNFFMLTRRVKGEYCTVVTRVNYQDRICSHGRSLSVLQRPFCEAIFDSFKHKASLILTAVESLINTLQNLFQINNVNINMCQLKF